MRHSLKGRLPVKLFKIKAQEIYDKWVQRQEGPVEKRLQFSDPWIAGWMKEYEVSLKKPNKRFAIKQEDRIIRILEYLKNILRVRWFFWCNYNVDPPIINGDQMNLSEVI